MQGEPEICRDFRKGVCFRVNCRYAHINADGTPGTPNDQPVCRDFENGRCFRSNCRFFHRSAPELLAANLANSKRQGEPSPHDLLDRFGPLGMSHPDYPSYPLGGNDLSPSGEFSRDARALLARELAKRELAISNRMLELSLAERALLELSIRERRQALGRLDPGPFQSLGRRDSVPVPGFHDLAQMGMRPSPTLPSSLNRTRSVPVQGFQDLRGVAPQRHADVIPGPRLDRRGSIPAQGMDLEGGEQEGFREGGGFGWQTPGGSERSEYPPGMGNPPLGRSTSETVQHLQEMRRAADSLLLDLERARRKESLSVPGSPELVGGEQAPQLELDPRILNRAGSTRGPVLNPEEGAQPEGGGFQGLERYASLRSAPRTPEGLGQAPAPLQKYASEPPGRGGGGQQELLEGRKSPQAVSDPRKSPEPVSDEGRMYGGVLESEGDRSMHGSERDGPGGLLSPEEGDPQKSRSLQASPETNPLSSQGFPGLGRGANGLTSPGLQGLNVNAVGGGMPGQELRRAGSGVPPPEGLMRSMGSISHSQGPPEGLVRSMGSINPNPNQGLPEGLVRSMGALTPNQGLARTNSGPFDFQGDPLRVPLSRRTSSTPTWFLGREDGPSPRSGGNSGAPPSLFAQYRDPGTWLSPEDQKEMFRHEQSKMYEDRAALERALRAQQLGRQLSGGFEGGPGEGRGGMDPEMAGRFAQAGHFRPELAGGNNQNPMDYARFPPAQQQQQQRQHTQQAQSQQHSSSRPQFTETAPGPPTPPASETVLPSPKDFQEYSPFGSQPSLFKENSGKSIW